MLHRVSGSPVYNAGIRTVSFKQNVQSNEEKPTVKVAINGATGRIGKTFIREWAAAELDAGSGIVNLTSKNNVERARKSPVKLEVVGINVGSPMSEEGLEYAFRFDSIMGNFPGYLKAKRDDDGKLYLYIGKDEANARKIRVCEQRNITAEGEKQGLPWKELDVDVAVDATGINTNKAGLQQHIDAGAKKAVCSAPAGNDKATGLPDVDKTIVYGVNSDQLQPLDKILSNASCTTTCIAPVIKVMNDNFGVDSGFVQTTHSATQSQFIADKSPKAKDNDFSKNRGSFDSIIPTTTGAAKAIGYVIPELNGRLNGLAARVPTSDVSIAYIILNLKQNVTKDQVVQTLKGATESDKYKDILVAAPKGATSREMLGRHESSSYIEDQIQVINGNMVVIPSYYDNEWGYTRSLMDLTRLAGAQIYNKDTKSIAFKGQTGNKLAALV